MLRTHCGRIIVSTPNIPSSLPDSPRTIRERGFPAAIGEPIALFEHDASLKAHRDYDAAKSGDQAAAVDLIWDIAFDFIRSSVQQLPHNVTFVAPFAREAKGDNAIPQVLASACAALTPGGQVDEDIVQTTRVFHTGADPMERLCLRAQFEGTVIPQQPYVLVDDVINMGGTLAELADFIQQANGEVLGVIALVNAGREKRLVPSGRTLRQLETRYPYEIRTIFGIEPHALTANEANYLVGFRTADEIRNRLAKARKEINLRLRSKGILWTDEGN